MRSPSSTRLNLASKTSPSIGKAGESSSNEANEGPIGEKPSRCPPGVSIIPKLPYIPILGVPALVPHMGDLLNFCRAIQIK